MSGCKSKYVRKKTQRGLKKGEYDERRQDCLLNNEYNNVEILRFNCWEKLKGDESVKDHMRNNFLFKLPLKQESQKAKI